MWYRRTIHQVPSRQLGIEECRTSQQIRSGRALASHRGRQTIRAEARFLQRLSWGENRAGGPQAVGYPETLTIFLGPLGEYCSELKRLVVLFAFRFTSNLTSLGSLGSK